MTGEDWTGTLLIVSQPPILIGLVLSMEPSVQFTDRCVVLVHSHPLKQVYIAHWPITYLRSLSRNMQNQTIRRTK